MLYAVGIVVVACSHYVVAQPMVEIDSGLVSGRRVRVHTYDRFVNSFYGIPFGEPVDGEKRFAIPERNEPWGDDVFNATTLGDQCLQRPNGILWLTHPGWGRYDEDCLNLNVFTPDDMDPAEPYAVMVWFFGGAFNSGGNIQYPGHFLAGKDVILVVPNYRVGVFGFLTTEDEVVAGNAGLHDQRLALEWIQSNIRAFGGDPERVTIFGQSAGGASVSLQSISPLSAGLFDQIIAVSGTDLSFWAVNVPEEQPLNYAKETADRNNCPTDDNQVMVDCLRALDAWQLRNNSGVTCAPGYYCLGHAPVIDGPGGMVPDYPLQMRKRGEVNQVGIMSGHTSDDGSPYTLAQIPDVETVDMNHTLWKGYVRNNLVGIWEEQITPEQFDDACEATYFYYTPYPYKDDHDLLVHEFNMMVTDGAFGYVVDSQLNFQAEFRDTYQYVFGFRSSNATFEGTEWMGVPHAGDLPYIFGWPILPDNPQVRLDSRILLDVIDFNQEDVEFTEFWMDAFTNYAKFGNPTPEPLDAPNNFGPVTWLKHTPEEHNYMHLFPDDVSNKLNHRSKANAFIREYASYLIGIELKKSNRAGLKRTTQGFDAEKARIAHNDLLRRVFSGAYPELTDLIEMLGPEAF